MDVCVLCVALSCVFLFYLVLVNNTTSYLWYAASCEIFVKTVGCLCVHVFVFYATFFVRWWRDKMIIIILTQR